MKNIDVSRPLATDRTDSAASTCHRAGMGNRSFLSKVPDSNAHEDREDQDYELSIHLLLPSAIVAQSAR
jgi:hypothetical protein